jgi:hypothetical protein
MSDNRNHVLQKSRTHCALRLRTITLRALTLPVKFALTELEAALGARVSQRVGEEWNGCRHGHRERTLTTSLGATTISMPRARLNGADGSSAEWHSETVRRYERKWQKRCAAVVTSLDERGGPHPRGVFSGIPSGRCSRP